MKLFNQRTHGYTDILGGLVLLAVPLLQGFPPLAVGLCHGLAGIIALLVLTTDHSLGLTRKIPFKIHGWIEVASTPGIAALPWIFHFEAQVRDFFLIFAAVTVVFWFLTDYRSKN